MAYGGKPSRGCQMCRIRRIKCDETKPTCKQCAKARRQCPGYRGADQSGGRHDVSRPTRADKTLAPSSASSSDDGSSPPTSPPDDGIPSLLRPPLKDVASCHFISNYVLIPRQGFTATRGWLEFVLPLLKQEPPIPHFKHAFNACAMASLNNRVGTGNDFERQALGHYTKALATTFTALRDPDMVKQDATLASILLLSLFESITAKSLGMFAWSSHVEGAIELVKTRGPEQLKTKTGMDLFAAVRIQMIIHSLSTGKAPSLGIEWWANDPVCNGHTAEFQQLSGRTGLLRNEVNSLLGTLARTPENTKLMKEFIRRCRALDKEVVDWLQGLPDIYRWKTVAWEDYNPKRDYAKAEAFPGRVDLYRDLWVVNMWNVMRCMRIVLASLIIRLTAWIISPADYRTTPEYAAISRTCGEAIADIIASIPYQLGWFSRRKDLHVAEQLSGFACGEDNTNKSLAGFFAIWPLVCVQGQDYLTDLQRVWVKGRLKCIANELGVRYADMLSQLNVRMPSMLILRDRLKGNPQNIPVDVGGASPGKQGSGGGGAAVAMPAPPGSSPESVKKQEAAYRKIIQDQTEQLKKQAVESNGVVDDWTVKTWLQL
ncbi:fungal specific transcription factor [Hirsutella rhossiliensis]